MFTRYDTGGGLVWRQRWGRAGRTRRRRLSTLTWWGGLSTPEHLGAVMFWAPAPDLVSHGKRASKDGLSKNDLKTLMNEAAVTSGNLAGSRETGSPPWSQAWGGGAFCQAPGGRALALVAWPGPAQKNNRTSPLHGPPRSSGRQATPATQVPGSCSHVL